MRYPEIARRKKISGRIYTSFKVDQFGKIKDLTFLSPIGGGCEEEISSTIDKLPYDFIPGRYNVEFVTAFTFKLGKELNVPWPVDQEILKGRVSLGEIIISAPR